MGATLPFAAMALREVEGPAGAPWERPMHGTLDRLVVESDCSRTIRSAIRRGDRCTSTARLGSSSTTHGRCRACT